MRRVAAYSFSGPEAVHTGEGGSSQGNGPDTGAGADTTETIRAGRDVRSRRPRGRVGPCKGGGSNTGSDSDSDSASCGNSSGFNSSCFWSFFWGGGYFRKFRGASNSNSNSNSNSSSSSSSNDDSDGNSLVRLGSLLPRRHCR